MEMIINNAEIRRMLHFSITCCFAININKSQDQSLSNIRFFPTTSYMLKFLKQCLKIIALGNKTKCSNIVSNVVYKKSLTICKINPTQTLICHKATPTCFCPKLKFPQLFFKQVLSLICNIRLNE